MLNANLKDLTALHGDAAKGLNALREIADLGGFGTIGEGPGQIHPLSVGGLDVAGVLSDDNTAVSEAAKNRIAKLCGEKRKEEFETTSSADKKQPDKK